MASNSLGDIFRFTSFGESHGKALGVVIDGCPAGLPLKEEDFFPELERRRPGQSNVTTARSEQDRPELLSGTFEGLTTGMPIALIIRNEDQKSKDYDKLRDHHRPGHADATYAGKYGHRDHRGGGRSSGRETVARVMAGVVARLILPPETRILAHAKVIGPHEAKDFQPDTIEQNPVRCADPIVAAAMEAHVLALKEAGDSVGGLVEILVNDPPSHLGDPVFSKLKNRLANAVMSVGAVTGFSYGRGFETVTLQGLDYVSDPANFGGILGGISNGDTLRLQASIKPTTSVADVARKGRHDPCIVPRVIPVLEAMVACVLADAVLMQRALSSGS